MLGMLVRKSAANGKICWPATVMTAAAMALSACGGGDDLCNGPFCETPPEQAEPSRLEVGPNNGQQGTAGRELPLPMAAVVKDDKDRPVSGVSVSFSVKTGGGTLSSATGVSNVDGLATVSWQLGPELGPQSLEATATDGDGVELENSPLELSAVAGQPAPATLTLLTTLSETAQNGIVLEQQPVLEVLDADGLPVPQVEVVASVSSGGATVSGGTTATSDGDGLATFTNLALIGPQGPQTLRFSVATPAVEVTALAPIQLLAGNAASMDAAGPTRYEGTVNSPVSPGPSVLVKDQAGNPAPGVTVSFTPNRSGSVSPEEATTNEQGVAQVSWTLGSTANVSYTLTARIESSPIGPVQFSAMARPGNAGRLRVAVQPSSPTPSGTAFGTQPVIQLEDQNGNPTPQAGVTVTATVSSGPSGSLANATATTDGSGRAAFSGLTLSGLVGSYTLTFSASGLVGVASSPFAITVGAAAKLAVITPPSTLARSRAPLPIQPVIQVQDASGNPIRQAGTVVVASMTAPNTSLTGESATTDESGRAVFAALTITGIPGPKDLTFSATGLQSASARVTIMSVETVSAAPTHPTSAMVGTTVAGPVITWTFRDAATRPVPDADFGLQLPSGGTVVAPQFSDEFGAVQLSNWTLGTTAGYQYLVLRLPDGREFRDSILATPDAAFNLVKVSGDNPIQSAPVNSQLPNQFVVRVLDRFGNGVANVPVQWSTCDGVAGPSVNTDESGYSGVNQPTGSQPSGDNPFCTRATAPVGTPVDFHYLVTGDASSQEPTGISGTESRHSGPPPVAPGRVR
jgi:hypothetical protein